MTDATESIFVAARIRAGTESSDEIGLVPGKPGSLRAKNLEFNLDRCFDESATQVAVFDAVGKAIVASVVDGYNGCIMAYGQTGSGKTFTMLGAEGYKLDSSAGQLDDGLGIVPRACHQLFESLPKGFQVTASYIEVYNDSVNDCLSEEKAKYLALREGAGGHVTPDGLTLVPVANTAEVMKTLGRGDKNRVVAAMAMNPRSSRGHGLICLDVFNKDGGAYSRLTLVDLAGMESSKKSFAVEGASNVQARREEAKRINMSLLALSSVVSALASKGAMRVPFRDSKLTRLLQSSLGGNCRAAICVTIRSEKQNIEEGINTLRFAQRAKSVQATVLKVEDQLNAKDKGGGAAAKKLAQELEMAKTTLADYAEKLAGAETYKEEMYMQVQTLMSEMKALQKENHDANKKRMVSEGGNSAQYISSLEKRIVELEEENRVLKQRDVMHRMIALDGGGAKGGLQEKDLATFSPLAVAEIQFGPGGFAVTTDHQQLEREHSGKGKALQQRTSQVYVAPNAGRRRWTLLGHVWRAQKKSRVHPAKAKRYMPKRIPLSQLSGEEKRNTAALRIQQVWRGFLERRDLDYWDDQFLDDFY